MRDLLSQRGAGALLIAAVGMAVMAFVVAVSAVGLTSAAQLLQRILAAVGFMGASAIAFWAGMELKRAETIGRFVPVPIPVRVRERRRVRR